MVCCMVPLKLRLGDSFQLSTSTSTFNLFQFSTPLRRAQVNFCQLISYPPQIARFGHFVSPALYISPAQVASLISVTLRLITSYMTSSVTSLLLLKYILVDEPTNLNRHLKASATTQPGKIQPVGLNHPPPPPIQGYVISQQKLRLVLSRDFSAGIL